MIRKGLPPYLAVKHLSYIDQALAAPEQDRLKVFRACASDYAHLSDGVLSNAEIADRLQDIAVATGIVPKWSQDDVREIIKNAIEFKRDDGGEYVFDDGVRPPEFSDEALALQFTKRHKERLRYVAAWNRWYCWLDGRWQPDETLHTLDLGRQHCREIASKCGTERIATAIASRKTITAVVSLARADRGIASDAGQWDRDLWTPLGYDIKERKLIINEREAARVRSIFTRFARGIPPQQLIEALAAEGAPNKQGKPIDKGYLYRVLHNRVYLGEAVHKGTAHPGEHDPIIDRGLWDQVHALIDRSPRTRATRALGRTPALLKGLIFGPTGAAMTPTHTRKSGRLYRYYVSIDVIRQGSSPSPIQRVPAAQIEDAVITQIRAMVQTPEIIVATWRAARRSRKGLTERQVRDELSRFDALWSELFPAEQARLVQLLVERVDISAKGVEITLRVEGLTSLMQELHTAAGEQRTAA